MSHFNNIHIFIFKKLLCLVVLAFFLSLAPFHIHQSSAFWGEFPEEIFGTSLVKAKDDLLGILRNVAKQAAAKALTSAISVSISGSSSQNSRIIMNYSDFLYAQPEKKAKLYINDLLSQSMGGRGSSSRYMPNNEGFGSAGGGNYYAQLTQMAQSTIINPTEPTVTYRGDPSRNLFANGSLANFNLYLSGINNPWAFNLYIGQKYNERLRREEAMAGHEMDSGDGFASTKDANGNVITPGSTIGSILSNAQNAGLTAAFSATSVSEVAISTVIQQMLTKVIENGIGNSSQNSARDNQYKEDLGSQLGIGGLLPS